MLLRVIGWLLLIEACFMMIPLVLAIIEQTLWVDFLWPVLITAGSGMILMSLRSHNRDVGKREAVLLTALTWVVLSLFGMLPFLFCGTHLSITDAFFETMSGFTTTGASVLSTLNNVPHSILLWRCIVQWIGGLGIILFTLAVIPMLNYQGGIQLFNAEVTGITHDKLRPRVSSTAKSLWLIYIVLTAVLIVLLCFSDMSIFEAVCHGLSTMSTGGFSTQDMNIAHWDSLYVKTVIMIFMFIGGVSFALIFKAVQRNFTPVVKNEPLRWYAFSVVIAYLLLCLNVVMQGVYHDWTDVTIDPLFQAVSIISSTGLTEPDFSDWGPLAEILLVGMMFMGACAGSTSGGAKIDRIIVMFKFLKNEFFQIMHPSAVKAVSINGKGIPYVVMQKVLAFLALYVIVIIVGGMILILFGLPLKDSLFCSLSAISNTGLGTDITGITGDYSLVPDGAKWVLSMIMLIGRLEIYTILLLFTRLFWSK